MTLEEAYKKLIAELEHVLAEAITETDEGDRDTLFAYHAQTLDAFIDFLEDTGNKRLASLPHDLWVHVMDLHRKADGGGATKPIRETEALAKASALATVFVQDFGYKLDAALREASKEFGLDKDALRNYRDHILRRNASNVALTMYDAVLKACRAPLAK